MTTSSEVAAYLSAYVMEVVESTSRSLRTVLIALHRPLLDKCGGSMIRSCVITHQDAARGISGCNFVDASIVGCV
jgi:hypothetical protein